MAEQQTPTIYRTSVYSVKKHFWTFEVINSLLIIALLGGRQLKVLPAGAIVDGLIVILFAAFLVQRLLAWFSPEAHTKKFIATLAIGIESIEWNLDKIPWANIESIKISYQDYKNRSKYSSSHSRKLSHGLDNRVEIALKNGRFYAGNLFIPSQEGSDMLNQVLWEVIKVNQISVDNANNLVHPANYAEHQEVKKLCA